MNTINAFGLYYYKAKVSSVYDGDSVTLDIDLGLNSWLKDQKVRLYGIDTPEIRGSERESGLISKARLVELVEGRDIVIETYKDKTGKYGRWLAIIWLFDDSKEEAEWININELLILEGLAEAYLK